MANPHPVLCAVDGELRCGCLQQFRQNRSILIRNEPPGVLVVGMLRTACSGGTVEVLANSTALP